MSDRKQVWGPSYQSQRKERKLILPTAASVDRRRQVGMLFGIPVFVDELQPRNMLTIECGNRRMDMLIADEIEIGN